MPADPSGPAFISYRQSDGTEHAVALAWALRAAGVPVWQDATDLPPGETRTRLEEALAGPLSGAVLVVTPELSRSGVVRDVELPQLLALSTDPAFTLSLASTIFKGADKLDYTAPDDLLRQVSGTLSAIKQYSVRTATERAHLARWHARRRVEALADRVTAGGGQLLLDVQTRVPPFATHQDGHLVLRLRPPATADRRPSRDGLHDLVGFTAGLPQLLALAGASTVRVRGGAHLSVAYALGAAMPTTLLGQVEVADTNGDIWVGAGRRAGTAREPAVTVVAETAGAGDAVLIYVDLLPHRSDRAFSTLAADHPDIFAAAQHLRATTSDFLDPAIAQQVVDQLDQATRSLASTHGTNEVHLLLRCPFPIALLLGRRLNTLSVRLYEWEDGPADDGSPGTPRYLPSLQVRSGAGGPPIEQVLLPQRPSV